MIAAYVNEMNAPGTMVCRMKSEYDSPKRAFMTPLLNTGTPMCQSIALEIALTTNGISTHKAKNLSIYLQAMY